MATFATREAYLTEAANLILDDLIMPIVEEASAYNYPRPDFRISVGFQKHSRSATNVADVYPREASTDSVNEIFINPEIDDPVILMQAMVPVLIKAVDNCASGHKGFYVEVLRKAGMENGTAVEPLASAALMSQFEQYSQLLGLFPHHKMLADAVHKKDGTRQIKVACSDPRCGFLFRTSRKQISKMRHDAHCPACNRTGTLVADA